MPYMVVLLNLLRQMLCLTSQNPCSTAFVAHPCTSFFGLTHYTSISPWVLDSGATDHITGVGTINLFYSLSIDNVLFVPGSPFNLLSISHLTRSLDCIISFTKDSISLQDQSSG